MGGTVAVRPVYRTVSRMRLVTWNILHGGGAARMPEIALSLIEHKPDLAVITEFRARTGGQIAGMLADHGLTFQASTTIPHLFRRQAERKKPADPATAGAPAPPAPLNGLLVASRFPLSTARDSAPSGPLGVKWLEVEIQGTPMALAGVHLPDDSRPTAKAAGWRHLLDYARRHRDVPCAIVGDFNTGRHFEDESGATFGSTDLLGALWTLGFRDAWRHLHPREREFTWHSHAGAGFRIDHAFLSGPLVGRLRAARYSHAERELRLSDHSVLLLDLA